MSIRTSIRAILLALALVTPVTLHAQAANFLDYLTAEERAILDGVQAAANEKVLEVLVLPVGTWQKRIAERVDAALAAQAKDPALTPAAAVALLRESDPALFYVPGSDYDLTIALRKGSRREEEEVVRRADQAIKKAFGGVKGAPDPSAVKVMGELAWNAEKYSGKAGATFATFGVRNALHFRPAAAGLSATRIPVASYYTLRGLTPPRGLNARAVSWIDDAVGLALDERLVAQGTGLTVKQAQLRSLIRVWDKSKSFFEPELAQRLVPERRELLMQHLPPIPAEVRELLALDKAALVERLKGLSLTEQNALFERTLDGLTEFRDKAAAVDLFGRAGSRATVVGDDAAAAVIKVTAVKGSLWRQLSGKLKASGPLAIWNLNQSLTAASEAYGRGDRAAFHRELALAVAEMAAGEVVLPALLAEAARDLAAAGLVAAADAAFFTPLNQAVLDELYTTTLDEGVFNMTGSPFEGWSPETLAAKYLMIDPAEARRAIARDAEAYVMALSAYRKGFLPIGPASLTEALTDALLADWLQSRAEVAGLEALARDLSSGYFVPAWPPLAVWSGEQPVKPGPAAPASVNWVLAPGEARSLEVLLQRRYGRIFLAPGQVRRSAPLKWNEPLLKQLLEVFERGVKVPSADGSMVTIRGRRAVDRVVADSTGTFEDRPLEISRRIVRACGGWQVLPPLDAVWEQRYGLAHPAPDSPGPEYLSDSMILTVQAPANPPADCAVETELRIAYRPPSRDYKLGSGNAGTLSVAERTQEFLIRVTAAAPARFTLEARVAHATTGAALGGATVTLTGARTLSQTTDAAGFVQFDEVPAGEYLVAGSRAGFNAVSTRVTVARNLSGRLLLTPVTTPVVTPVTVVGEARPTAAAGGELTATLGAGLLESYGAPQPPVPVGVFKAPGPGRLFITFTYRGAPRPELQYATGYGQGYRTEAVLRWSGGVVIEDRLAAGELRGRSEVTKTLPITVRDAGEISFAAVGEWTLVRQVDGRWVDGPGGGQRHYLPGAVSVALRFVPAK